MSGVLVSVRPAEQKAEQKAVEIPLVINPEEVVRKNRVFAALDSARDDDIPFAERVAKYSVALYQALNENGYSVRDYSPFSVILEPMAETFLSALKEQVPLVISYDKGELIRVTENNVRDDLIILAGNKDKPEDSLALSPIREGMSDLLFKATKEDLQDSLFLGAQVACYKLARHELPYALNTMLAAYKWILSERHDIDISRAGIPEIVDMCAKLAACFELTKTKGNPFRLNQKLSALAKELNGIIDQVSKIA